MDSTRGTDHLLGVETKSMKAPTIPDTIWKFLLMIWPIILLSSMVSCDTVVSVTLVNQTSFPLRVYGPGSTYVRPLETLTSAGGSLEADKDTPHILVKAYQIQLGPPSSNSKNEMLAWIDNGQILVDRGVVRLVYCETFTGMELEVRRWKITIKDNVPQTAYNDPPEAPCPCE